MYVRTLSSLVKVTSLSKGFWCVPFSSSCLTGNNPAGTEICGLRNWIYPTIRMQKSVGSLLLFLFVSLLVLQLEGAVENESSVRDRVKDRSKDRSLMKRRKNESMEPWSRRRMMQAILGSGQEALTVTKKRFLRKDRCQSQALLQRVSRDQCLSVTIINRFCYGQCNSFFIPKNVNASRETNPAGSSRQGSFQSCAICRPQRSSWTTVTLKCPSLTPNIRRQRVQIVKQCRCMSQEADDHRWFIDLLIFPYPPCTLPPLTNNRSLIFINILFV